MLPRILARSAAIAALSLTAAACLLSRVGLYAAPESFGPVQISVGDAFTSGPRVTVKLTVTNNSGKPLSVNPEGFDLRVGGKLLPHRAGILATKKPITVAAGAKHDLEVEFRADHDLDNLSKAALVVGGISAPSDAPAKVMGEIILSASQGM